MANRIFKNRNLFPFFKNQFERRQNSHNFIRRVMAGLQLGVIGFFNFHTQKDWNRKYELIENSIIDFYPELQCEIKVGRPKFISLLKNLGKERILFDFNKAHVAVTKEALYFFPYNEPDSNSFNFYNYLQDSFSLVYKLDNEKRKHRENKISSFFQ